MSPADPGTSRGDHEAARTKRGTMATDRPERYAKQLAGHWAKRGSSEEADGVVVLRFDSGQVVEMRPTQGALEVTVTVPEGGDVDRFAEVVAEHLARFGQREELDVVWA